MKQQSGPIFQLLIEMQDSKFRKVKYHRGRFSEGHQVFLWYSLRNQGLLPFSGQAKGKKGSNSTLRRFRPVPVSDQLKNNFNFCNSFINNRTFKF